MMAVPTSMAEALAQIDKLRAERDDADKAMVALVIERAMLRAHIEEMSTELNRVSGRLNRLMADWPRRGAAWEAQ